MKLFVYSCLAFVLFSCGEKNLKPFYLAGTEQYYKENPEEFPPSIVEHWQLYEFSSQDVVIFDKFDPMRMGKNYKFVIDKAYPNISDSVTKISKVNNLIEMMIDIADDYYVEFSKNQEVYVSFPVLAKPIGSGFLIVEEFGIYELDDEKLRIDFEDPSDYNLFDGSFHWFRLEEQLRIYPDLLNDTTTHFTFYLD